MAMCRAFNVPAQQALQLVARYTMADNTGFYQADSSGNNNNINGGGSWVPNPNWGFTTNGIAGGGALTLDGGENLGFSPGPESQGGQTFDSWLATFYGSFSISLWINTTNVLGDDSDDLNGNNDAQIIDGYYDGINDTIPIALTGHKVAFFTGDPTGFSGDTLHSTASVTTGNWVHIVVTRDGATGEKTIYINGALDSSDLGVTNPLDGDTNGIEISGGPGASYAGALDDLQIYSGVLNASNVAWLYANPGMVVSNVPGNTNNPIAFYDFDESTPYAADLTADGYNIINGGNFGGPVLTTNSVSESGAVYFNGGSFLTPSSNLLSTLAEDFSLSLWVKTTQNIAWNTAPAYYGAGVFCADNPGLANDLVPIALTGGAVAFNTGGAEDDTLNSAATVNDGNYHHVVVTRDEATGAKEIYVDGVLSASGVGTAGLLNAPQLITIGALADASNPDPTSPSYTGYNGFIGSVDDIQMYSRVISSNEVAFLYSNPGLTVTNNLVVHYDFDEGTVQASDVSGNGNDMVYAGSFQGPGPEMTADAASGPSALSFDGGSYLTPNNLATNFAGTFSLSVWLATTQSLGSAGDPADEGAGVVTAEVPGQNYDLIPLALTGGNVAFQTDGDISDVLTSETAINDGNYHHVVITRDQNTGEKQIYIDGILDADDSADSALLTNPQILVLGCQADASQSDPNSPASTGYNGYAGLMDQLQVYSRVLSADEVAYLYNNPGATLFGEISSNSSPPANTNEFGEALGEPGLTWTTGGNASWFIETTNTFSTNTAAAQSGSITGDDIAVLSTTITGACEVSFEWQTMANSEDPFNLQFLIDGNSQKQIIGDSPWAPESFYTTPGVHTLDWEATAAASPSDAGFLDQVVITPSIAPEITASPFSQTNYPGYAVGLLAAATGTPTPTWQWYQEGNPSPLPGATNAFIILPYSGQSSVAGTYYAIASNNAGSAMTTPAKVTFINGPAPLDWSSGFVSPIENYNSDSGVSTASTNVYYSCVVDSTGTNEFSSGYAVGTNFYYNAGNQITTIFGQAAAIIVKQNLAAVHPVQWVVAVTNNGNGDAYAEGLALAPNGGVYAVGYFTGVNWLGSTLLQDSGAGTTFLARLDANGNLLWLAAITNSFPVPVGVVSDASGNVTLTAIVNGSTTIGGTNYPGPNQTSFVAQFNSAGTLNWVDRSSNPVEYLAGGFGRVYASLINYFSTNDSIAGLSNNSAYNYSVAAINATNGNGIWLQGAGEAAGSFASGLIDDVPEIAVSSNYVFLVGTAYGSNAVFGAYSVGITNGRGQYFARYDTSGNAQLATGFGGNTTQPWATVASPSGNVYVAGAFDSYADFGNYILAGPHLATFKSAYAFSQAFLAKFDTNGVPQWALQAIAYGGGDPSADFINLFDVALGGENVWVAGTGSGPIQFGRNLPTSNEVYENDYTTFVSLPSGMLGFVTDNPPVSAVLMNVQSANTGFQFSFVSDAGHTNIVQDTTNLLTGAWMIYTNITGDGTLKTITVPSTNHPAEFFRVETQ